MLEIKIDIDKESLAKIKQLPERARAGFEAGLSKAAMKAEQFAKREFTNHLHVRTGNLRRSIRSGTVGNTAWIGSNVVYARIQEIGGTIRPKKGKYLRFQINGKWRTAREVVIPPRPFLAPAINDHKAELATTIRDTMLKEINNG